MNLQNVPISADIWIDQGLSAARRLLYSFENTTKTVGMTSEEHARETIGGLLTKAGWTVKTASSAGIQAAIPGLHWLRSSTNSHE